jgi:hypothetical protein
VKEKMNGGTGEASAKGLSEFCHDPYSIIVAKL